VILFRDLFCRLLQSRRWIAAQFGLTLLLILIGLAWMRLPEKHVWQVLLSLLLPLLLAAHRWMWRDDSCQLVVRADFYSTKNSFCPIRQ